MESKTRSNIIKATCFAIAAAVLYAISSPFSKILLEDMSPTMMAAFLYLGAGIGLFIFILIRKMAGRRTDELPLDRTDLPYTLAMIVLDILAPILLMTGLSMTSAATTSLLNNFEIVATTVIALMIFKERISPMLWVAILLVTVSSVILTVDDLEGLVLSPGALLVLGACLCWGLENNCTRRLSSKDPIQITTVKGIFSGLGSLAIALAIGSHIPSLELIAAALVLGFLSYGLSISTYIRAQRDLGAARVSAYYSLAPFIGVAISVAFLGDSLDISFIVALVVMIAGAILVTLDALTSENRNKEGSASGD